MTANKPFTAPDFADDAPDLSAPEWREKFAAAAVRRGRPRAPTRKVSTTIRLDPDILGFAVFIAPFLELRVNYGDVPAPRMLQ